MKFRIVSLLLVIVLVSLIFAGGSIISDQWQDLFDQPHIKPLETGSLRSLPIDSVSVDGNQSLTADNQFNWSENDISSLPQLSLDKLSIPQGKTHFEDYCKVCHGNSSKRLSSGLADTEINKVGMVAPSLPTLTAKRTHQFIYLKIKNGGTIMPRLGHMVSSDERWLIIAYVRSIEQ